MAEHEDTSIVVQSMVASRTKAPYVAVRLGDTKGVQISAPQARQVGLAFLSAAEAAEFDAALYRGLRDHGFSDEDVARILLLVRSVREKEEGRDGG